MSFPREAGTVHGTTRPEPAASALRSHALDPVLRAVSEGIVIADRDGAGLVFNAAAERMLGQGPADVPLSDWSATYGLFLPDGTTPFPGDDLPLARALRGESRWDIEIHVRRPGQRALGVIRVTALPLRSADGELLGAVAVMRDVTAHQNADAMVRRLSNAVEQSADSIYITDHRGVIEYVNAGFERITGYRRDEVLGHTPRMLRSGLHEADHYAALWTTLLAGETYRGTMVNRRRDGGIYYAEMTITPIRAYGGAITHFVAVGKDMTERRLRQEQELELNLARSVQRALFPAAPPSVAGLDLAGVAHPATAMCGDFYDYVRVGDRVALAIGDVSGHGMGPALVMAETRAYLRAYLGTLPSVTHVLRTLNHMLAQDLTPGSFVTMTLVELDPHARTLTYASAGHPTGFVLDAAGDVRAALESTGPPLGISPHWDAPEPGGVTLEPGDLIVLVTDGITESAAPDGRLLGSQGALEIVLRHRAGSAQQVLDGLVAGVREFAREAPQSDDITAVVCRLAPEA